MVSLEVDRALRDSIDEMDGRGMTTDQIAAQLQITPLLVERVVTRVTRATGGDWYDAVSGLIPVLSPEEEQSVVDHFHREPRRARGKLGGLLKGWIDFVAQVEEGYVLGGEDYTNDLTKRDILARIMRSVTPSLVAKLEAVIDPWDRCFQQATHPMKQPWRLSPGHIDRLGGLPWWYERFPRKLTGEFPRLARVNFAEEIDDDAIIGE